MHSVLGCNPLDHSGVTDFPKTLAGCCQKRRFGSRRSSSAVLWALTCERRSGGTEPNAL